MGACKEAASSAIANAGVLTLDSFSGKKPAFVCVGECAFQAFKDSLLNSVLGKKVSTLKELMVGCDKIEKAIIAKSAPEAGARVVDMLAVPFGLVADPWGSTLKDLIVGFGKIAEAILAKNAPEAGARVVDM